MKTPSINILVLFYSFGGHTAKLAESVAEGVKEVEGTQVAIKQVPELLPESFFSDKPQIQKERESFAHIPIATMDDLLSSDAIAFGSPVHFGTFASQIKQFIDQLSPVYVKGSLVNKPAALFTSSGSTHGGEEVALLSFMIPLLNLGMLPVGVPYPVQGVGPEFDAGSPYGAIYVTGHKGDKPLPESEKKIARILGKRLAAVTKVLHHGADLCPDCAFLYEQYT